MPLERLLLQLQQQGQQVQDGQCTVKEEQLRGLQRAPLLSLLHQREQHPPPPPCQQLQQFCRAQPSRAFLQAQPSPPSPTPREMQQGPLAAVSAAPLLECPACLTPPQWGLCPLPSSLSQGQHSLQQGQQ